MSKRKKLYTKIIFYRMQSIKEAETEHESKLRDKEFIGRYLR